MSLLEVLFTGNGDRTFTLGGTRVGNLSGTSVGGNTFSGVIGDSVVRDGSGDPILDAGNSPTVLGVTHLVKEGPGTWVINPLTNSTYSGTTRINGGTLVVSTLDSFLFQEAASAVPMRLRPTSSSTAALSGSKRVPVPMRKRTAALPLARMARPSTLRTPWRGCISTG